MCGAWNVDRGRGKKGERPLSVLRQELQAKLAKGASELHRASEPSTSLLVNLSATHPFFGYMESRRWGRCQHCRKRGDTFRISQNSQERLCRECSRRHAPWIDATLKESTYNLSHSDDSESSSSAWDLKPHPRRLVASSSRCLTLSKTKLDCEANI